MSICRQLTVVGIGSRILRGSPHHHQTNEKDKVVNTPDTFIHTTSETPATLPTTTGTSKWCPPSPLFGSNRRIAKESKLTQSHSPTTRCTAS